MRRAQCRPFGRRFLDPAFAKLSLAGGNQRRNFVLTAGLGDGNQRNARRIALRLCRGRANSVADQRQTDVG